MASDRGQIFLEQATVLEQRAFPAEQFVLRVAAPRAAASAAPGSFAHIRCADSVPLRRPLSIMRADAAAGWVEFLYKPVGAGLAKLALCQPGESLSILAPIGKPFSLDPALPKVLALGGGVGIPPMVFVAERLAGDARFETVVLMGSEVPFPFETGPGRPNAALPEGHAMALLEGWDVSSRLASLAGLPGSFAGFVTDLARHWLDHNAAAARARTQIIACGPEPMLRAAARLSAEYDVYCELALEEFMACGVGGCAGCTVLVQEADGPAMKRVCVDGPVFAARKVYPELDWQPS